MEVSLGGWQLDWEYATRVRRPETLRAHSIHLKLLTNVTQTYRSLSIIKSVWEVNSTAFLGKLFGLLTTLLKVRIFICVCSIVFPAFVICGAHLIFPKAMHKFN